MTLIDDHPRLNTDENDARRRSIINNGGKTAGSIALAGGGTFLGLDTLCEFAQNAGQIVQSDEAIALTMTFSAAAITAGVAGVRRYFPRTLNRIEGIGIRKISRGVSPNP
ncbi:MAG: hypothetical protein R3D66_06175 [Alphaproteobacteria bacterium]